MRSVGAATSRKRKPQSLLPLYTTSTTSQDSANLSSPEAGVLLNFYREIETSSHSSIASLRAVLGLGKKLNIGFGETNFGTYQNPHYREARAVYIPISKTAACNFGELAVEAFFFLRFYVVLVPVKTNLSIHSFLRKRFSHLDSWIMPIPDLVALCTFSAISVFISWAVCSILIPLWISRSVGFSRKIYARPALAKTEFQNTKHGNYDPLVFALVKLAINCYIYMYYATFSLEIYGNFKLFRGLIALQLGFYNLHLLRMGVFPLISGAIITATSFYSRLRDKRD
ncbi:hypothetical protein METBIDRAFT_11845 [Metschnikowia bicuspidata var. bicuspidata NRRL YB-4993]|uniref:Uncharacterized protein n=1 Tax=Metschnikowia bicuspidata var. bicuspidata NRRL YB-4993 TaxID=869754 RepID=A0A1A0HBQ4_9ASCO|nr:hypothetical protein METBIDRAFT_11845 [Metschnikowia bicuspidata var. bicuspidata NRRL YB-4993]OBA21307.1 hypothetical protein METBIDRAFT_11845 [Metschnikowia bicuspidata var. bicuspidata NRRL YB-4993]